MPTHDARARPFSHSRRIKEVNRETPKMKGTRERLYHSRDNQFWQVKFTAREVVRPQCLEETATPQ